MDPTDPDPDVDPDPQHCYGEVLCIVFFKYRFISIFR